MEKLLYYVWEHRLFDNRNLLTTKGEKIEIIDPGHRNSDSGPDFFNAKIRIGEKLWQEMSKYIKTPPTGNFITITTINLTIR